MVRTHPIERYQALCDSAPCISRAATPPEGHQIEARKRRAPGNTILSQPYRRCVSTDRLNREGNQLASSLEGEPGPTPTGKTLPHSYPKTRFRRERVRDCTMCYHNRGQINLPSSFVGLMLPFIVCGCCSRFLNVSPYVYVLAGTFNMPSSYQTWVWEREAHINWSMMTCQGSTRSELP